MMDIGEVVKNNNSNNNNNNNNHHLGRESLCKAETSSTPSSDFGLQWGNRKRLRCMKIQVKSDSTNTDKTKVRINRGVDKPISIKDSNITTTTTTVNNNNSNFRRPVSPPPLAHRISRNSETMKGQSNGGVKAAAANISPDRVVGEEKDHHKKGNNNNNNNGVTVGVGGGASGSSETALDSKKGGSSSGSGDAIPVWLPKFVIALTNKEKEEDFMAIKGSKLPQRPKKRAKFVQRTLNLVSPGAWLCDLTLERYEVREKKISKKRPRGLKAMGNMDSDSD